MMLPLNFPNSRDWGMGKIAVYSRRPGSPTAADEHTKLQSDRAILNPYFMALTFGDKTSYRLVNKGPANANLPRSCFIGLST